MISPARGRRLHQLFMLGVATKGFDAVIECAGGIALFVIGTATIAAWIDATQEYLIGTLGDVIGRHLLTTAAHFFVTAKSFSAAYLLGHGAIKGILVAGLLKGSSWAYPFALIGLGGFIVYQTYRILLTFSVGLVALTLFDGVVFLLIWYEWRTVSQRRG
jgi:uncharacterized membrane protein